MDRRCIICRLCHHCPVKYKSVWFVGKQTGNANHTFIEERQPVSEMKSLPALNIVLLNDG